MPFLKPEIVARAAHALFGRAHAYSMVFFFLKAAGSKPGTEIRATSSNEAPSELILIAGQPDGFDKLVDRDYDKIGQGLPTKPAGHTDYTLYFPICHKQNQILRKKDANRNAVWTNLREPANKTPNSERYDGTAVYEFENVEGEAGCVVRLKADYVKAAHWYYGPEKNVPMMIPLEALAIWLHRSQDLPKNSGLDGLIDATIQKLNLQPEELHFIFRRGMVAFNFDEKTFTNTFDLESYFKALCLEPKPTDLPQVEVSDEVVDRSPEAWDVAVRILGLRKETSKSPEDLALQQINSAKLNILLYGPPRTGKSYSAITLAAKYLGVDRDKVESDPRFSQVQFHPGWTYGDFMRKLIPMPQGNSIVFDRLDGKFLRHCGTYRNVKSVFLIEEINRANVAAVLGEAFHLMEMTKRGLSLDLPGSRQEDEIKTLSIPPDLLIMATANNVDRSTFPLDAALLGRFATIDFPVDHNSSYKVLSGRPGWNASLAESFVLRVVCEIEKQARYPIGHAFFYEMPEPARADDWYKTALKPTLRLHLTQYRGDVLEGVDALFEHWVKL